VVDWVLVSLRSDTTETDSDPVCETAALLHNDGVVEFVTGFDCCDLDLDGEYFLVIEQRNHLVVMSDTLLPVVDGTITYDFRNTQSFIHDEYGVGYVGQKLIIPGEPDVYAMFAGNGDQTSSAQSDTDINYDDRDYWEDQNGTIGNYINGDYNLNGDCNFNDRILWEFNNGKFTSVPRD
jgi:hypothetical protein